MHYGLRSDFESYDHILFPMPNHVGVHLNVNYLQTISCDKSRFKFSLVRVLTFDLEGQVKFLLSC